MINAEMICHQDISPVSFHICHMLQRSYKTDIKGKEDDGIKIKFENWNMMF